MHPRRGTRGPGAAATLLAAALLGGCAGGGPSPGPPGYLARAHSHNDYERPRPLSDAVGRGFASVEVDVVLQDGILFVAHGPEDIRGADTLTRLYLDALRELVASNEGRIYDAPHPPLQLLVDVKSEADATYLALSQALSAYGDMFTTWTRDGVRPGPVAVVLSGNRARELLLADSIRYMALDGRLHEDRGGVPTDVMPLVSVDWASIEPETAPERLARAQEIVDVVRGEGRRVRFWGTPDCEDVWRALVAMGADYIGTDDAPRLERLLRAQQ